MVVLVLVINQMLQKVVAMEVHMQVVVMVQNIQTMGMLQLEPCLPAVAVEQGHRKAALTELPRGGGR